MKKLLLLFLAVAGMVSTVSADNVTVYFKPDANTWGKADAQFKLVTAEDGNGTTTDGVMMEETSQSSGIYYAVINNSNYSQFKFARISSDGNSEWNKHDTWTTLETNKYYVMNGLYDNNWTKLDITTRDLSQTWYIAGGHHITNGYVEWSTESDAITANTLATSPATSLSLAVSNKPLKAGTYEFKFVGDEWVGDGSASNTDHNYELTIDVDGVYDLTYTFNQLTRTGSVSATKTADASEITYKYYVWDENSSITGKAWENNEMTTSATNTVSYTANNSNLVSGTSYKYKVVEKIFKGEELINTYWPNNNTDDGCWYVTSDKNRAYDVSFNFYLNANFKMSSSNPSTSLSAVETGYYFIKDDNGWRVGDRLTESETGVYTGTISNLAGGYFAILPATALSAWDKENDKDWSSVIRPSADKPINFVLYSESVGSNGVWNVPSDFDGSIDFTYDANNSKWSAAPYFERTIKAESKEAGSNYGYATFSSTYSVKIPSDLTAYYGKEVNTDGAVVMSPITNANKEVSAGDGILLKGTAGNTYKFTPAENSPASIASSNLLVGCTIATSVPASTESTFNYVFGKDANGVGFYQVTSNSGTITCPAGGAYLSTSTALTASGSGARVAMIFLGDDASGINSVQTSQSTNGYYDLQGRRVAQPTKGLYIVNGKKVIMK